MQVPAASTVALERSLPGSGAEDWFPTATSTHRPARTIGTAAELQRRKDSIQLFSPSTEAAVAADPILGGELVVRLIDAEASPAVLLLAI